VLRADPTQASVRYTRAQVHRGLGDPGAALLDYEEVVRQQPAWGDHLAPEIAACRASLGR
jgi:hypothetical protein